ncbi:11957_t:CDS:2, partial [Gigaspora margarita]
NVNLDLENTLLDNVQSNTHIEHYQRSRSPSVEPQSQKTYNEIQQNQRNTQIRDSPNYNTPLQVNRRSTNSSTQSIEPRIDSFLERSYQHLSNQNYYLVEDKSSLSLQMSRRSINSSAQSIEPQINSFSEQSDQRLSNQNHYDLDEDESSKDEIFFLFGQNYNSNPLKELFHSNILSNMQNVNSYLDIQSGLTTSSVKNGLFFQDETHLIRWLEACKDIVLQ